MATILIVEDDKSTRILTLARLRPHYTCLTACDGEEAIDIFYKQHVDLILADVMMPNMDGYELVRTLREYKHDVPVILLTAKAAFEDKREGFSSGIDDYLTKPVNYEELLWHIEALLRRAGIHAEQKIEIGDVTVDASAYSIERKEDGHSAALPKKEFELLFKLLSSPGQIFTKEQLLEDIWGYETESDDSTIKTHINRLRSKLKEFHEFEIVTVRGLGYKGEIKTGEHT